MTKFNIISSDSHVFEPPDLWTTRIEAKFRDRAPHVVRGEEYDMWYLDPYTHTSMGQATQAGRRFTDPATITIQASLDDVPVGTYEPAQHVKDLELDGVDAEVVFPTVGLVLYRLKDGELLSAIFRAYNSWLADFCSYKPDQLKGIAMINVDDVEDAVNELTRSRKMGLSGAMISTAPNPDPTDHHGYEDHKYEPLWAAAQDLNMPLHLHVGTVRYDRDMTWDRSPPSGLKDYAAAVDKMTWICHEVQRETWVRRAVTAMMFTGVFERYPKFQVGIVEHELSWIPHFLYMMDAVYKERQMFVTHRFKNDMLPSDFFHRNVFAGFQEDDAGIRLRDIIGVDNLLWGNDYPHSESTFPKSREILDRIFAGVPQDEREKIVAGNAARIYQFD